MSYYFGFNTPEEQKKKRKSDLTAIGEKVTSFFWDIAPANGFEMREGQQDISHKHFPRKKSLSRQPEGY